jgi:hypothetical protein
LGKVEWFPQAWIIDNVLSRMQEHLMQVFSHLNKGFLQASAHYHEGGFFVFLSSKMTSPRFKEVLCILFTGI